MKTPRINPKTGNVYGWEKRIAASQLWPYVELTGGAILKRIPFNRKENIHATCPDCSVKLGQLHVSECGMETCPKCKDQLLFCGHAINLINQSAFDVIKKLRERAKSKRASK